MKDKLIKRQGLNIIVLFILIIVALFTINNIVVMAKIDTNNYLYLNAIQDSIIWNSIKLSTIIYCTFLLGLKINSNFKLLESINQTRSIRKSVKLSNVGNNVDSTRYSMSPADMFSNSSVDDLFMARDIIENNEKKPVVDLEILKKDLSKTDSKLKGVLSFFDKNTTDSLTRGTSEQDKELNIL